MVKDATGCGLDHGGDAEPGLRRRGRTRLTYVDERHRGRVVKDPRELERIRRLAIPPAWTDVWISANPSCHLQATGRDARGRKQYRYHPDYRTHRETTKFDQLAAFGAVLGTIRRTVDQDLDRKAPSSGSRRSSSRCSTAPSCGSATSPTRARTAALA